MSDKSMPQIKTVLVTGGARGIGRLVALRFAKDGLNVALLDYNNIENGLVEEIEKVGGRALRLQGDVSNFAEAERMVKEAVAAFGRIDILVNNAGITRDNLLIRMSESDFDSVIAVNLKGSFNMTRHVAGVMLKQRSGAIINISSVAGLGGNTGQANYSSSKAGLIGLTKTTAKELASRNITCNAIAPGAIETDMTRILSEDVRAKMLTGIPLGRFGDPEDVAETVYFLANSRYITGEVICIDGGMMLL